jgi:hypothetical protein
MALGRKAKRRRKEVSARGNSYVESAECEEAKKDDMEDDEPIATLASKKKKLKTCHKLNQIQDKIQCPDKEVDPFLDVSPVQDESRRNDNESQSEEEEDELLSLAATANASTATVASTLQEPVIIRRAPLS